jgi:hypothetical protein
MMLWNKFTNVKSILFIIVNIILFTFVALKVYNNE